jgi:hypothetical protein
MFLNLFSFVINHKKTFKTSILSYQIVVDCSFANISVKREDTNSYCGIVDEPLADETALKETQQTVDRTHARGTRDAGTGLKICQIKLY